MSRYILHTTGSGRSGVSKNNSQNMGFDVSGNSRNNLYINPNSVHNNTLVKPFANVSDKPKGNFKISVPHEKIITKLNETLGIYDGNISNQVKRYTEHYNRFKLPNVDEAFNRGFAHVFFVRPDCNIISHGNSNSNYGLQGQISADPDFRYLYDTQRVLLSELTGDIDSGSDFMLSLSNHAASFACNDEGIETDSYGQNFIGYKVSYGKHDVSFKTAGEFTVDFDDDKELNIYKLNRLWVHYIANVYRGIFTPRTVHIRRKILDYAGACYYIVTAEDGETIIFWTKLYGVFPKTIPSTQFGWSKGTTLTADSTRMSVTYAYSFKEDCNPLALAEFNKNAHVTGGASYIPTYDPSLGHAGRTWVGTPFIEYNDAISGSRYKLRFKP